jgi:hypothetical protein
MNKMNKIYYKTITCNFCHGAELYDISNGTISNVTQEIYSCRTIQEYIRGYSEYIKENVIRNLKELKYVTVNVCIFDKNNKRHWFLVDLFNFICDMLKIKKYAYTKSIVVEVRYYNNIVFAGQLCFDGLI